MSLLALIRHGATDWNAERRLQGRADRPLSAAGREAVRLWRVPSLLDAAAWVTSPLERARETAALLGRQDCIV
jgi:probable phosphoglycerate mutase